ncbi:MAG TPA: hypothetical protein PLE79_08040 [Clostridia bacterium]|nr:hypothetical protein [Clostridia bacterium]
MIWLKYNARALIYVVLAAFLGAWGGYELRGSQIDTKEPMVEVPEAQPVGHIGKPSILPETEVKLNYEFLLCGHVIEKTEKDGELTGLRLEDIANKYPDCRVLEFDEAHVVISRELERYCPKHYILFLDDNNKLCILHTDEADFEKEVVTVLNYDVSALPEEVLDLLKEGISFASLEEINLYLEDAES